MDWIEIFVCRMTIWFLRRGYGANCETKDTDDFPEMKSEGYPRCASCQAREVIELLEEHIHLIQS
jgi:hypothetical protein